MNMKRFFRKISLIILYWIAWKLGNRNVHEAYYLLRSENVIDRYLKTLTTWDITRFCTKKIREVAEYDLRAIILRLLENRVGHYIGPERSDNQFFHDYLEELYGSYSFYNNSLILYDGSEIECPIQGADQEITRLVLMIQLILSNN